MSEPNVEDATRRTHLANERTYLAWWRTGLTAFAAAVGTGKLVPELSAGSNDGYTAVGVAFALLGVACCGFAVTRFRAVEAALARGDFAPPQAWTVTALGTLGALIGAALVLLLLLG